MGYNYYTNFLLTRIFFFSSEFLRQLFKSTYFENSFRHALHTVATLEPDHNSTRAKKHPVTASPLKASGCWRGTNTEKGAVLYSNFDLQNA